MKYKMVGGNRRGETISIYVVATRERRVRYIIDLDYSFCNLLFKNKYPSIILNVTLTTFLVKTERRPQTLDCKLMRMLMLKTFLWKLRKLLNGILLRMMCRKKYNLCCKQLMSYYFLILCHITFQQHITCILLMKLKEKERESKYFYLTYCTIRSKT